jgi:hypothetical protein
MPRKYTSVQDLTPEEKVIRRDQWKKTNKIRSAKQKKLQETLKIVHEEQNKSILEEYEQRLQTINGKEMKHRWEMMRKGEFDYWIQKKHEAHNRVKLGELTEEEAKKMYPNFY